MKKEALRRCASWLLVVALIGVPGGAQANDGPTSLVEWLQSRGHDSSFVARKAEFERAYPTESYAGTLAQNMKWLMRLRSALRRSDSNQEGRASGEAPTKLDVHRGAWTLTLDRSGQVLHLDLPKDVHEAYVKGKDSARSGSVTKSDTPIHATIPPSSKKFVSAGALSLKAKQFDDRLYAAVEQAARHGCGTFHGKMQLVLTIAEALELEGACEPGNGPAVLFAASTLAVSSSRKTPECVRSQVDQVHKAFLANKLRSKPIGFYTRSQALKSIFLQDRLLQTPLEGPQGIEALAHAIERNEYTRSSYESVLRLNAGLSNELVGEDLRSYFDGKRASARSRPCFYPPSRAYETDLAKKLWGNKPIPPGANLMNELIERIQSGAISVAPRESSGWYDHQTWALEPLLRPDHVSESPRLSLSTSYRTHLVDLFKSVLALTRETHVKQLENMLIGAYAPMPKFNVSPRLTVEPLATHYKRRADAYRFVRGVLEDAFGKGTLRELRWHTSDGIVSKDIDTELRFMEHLFEGAAATAHYELGSSEARDDASARLQRFVFRRWRTELALDADIGRDTRMMVPVFYDLMRNKTKVWVFLGWQQRPLVISYKQPPVAGSVRGPKGRDERKPEVSFKSQRVNLACPVMVEVYVDKILNRDEFRAHCDKYKTKSAILKNLK